MANFLGQMLLLGSMLIGSVLLCAAAVAEQTAAGRLEVTVCGGQYNTPEALGQLRCFEDMGATSVQIYVYWKDIEKTPGVYDWSAYDAAVANLRQARLRWVPFLIAGPWYVTPEFVRQEEGITFARCVEHGQDSRIPSIWCNRFKSDIEKWMGAFAEHYVKTGILESVNLGITGDYGEAIYPVTGNWPGEYHSHAALWCGDDLAVADFQRACKAEYGSVKKLNVAWNTGYKSFKALRPFAKNHAPCPEAWLFEVQWYRNAMTDYARWWLETARRAFGETPLYLCTGGDMAAVHGSDFSAQAKAAAACGAGLRITNEASSFPGNVYLTRLVVSSCRFYGAYAGNEPAASVTPAGTLGRLFNSISGGFRQLFVYEGNVMDGAVPNEAADLLKKHREYMVPQRPKIETAVLYPTTSMIMDMGPVDFYYRIRDRVDYDFVDERMAIDGALDGYKILIVYRTKWIPDAVVAAVSRWVENGGTLIAINSRPVNIDERSDAWDKLVGIEASSSMAFGICGVTVEAPEILTSFASPGGWIFSEGYAHLAADVRSLLRQAYPAGGSCAWFREVGKGAALCYFGPGDSKPDETAWASAPPLPLYFVKDAIEYLAASGKLDHVPQSLCFAKGSVYVTETAEGGLLVLNMDEEEAKISRWAKEFILAPKSISRLQP